MAALLLLILAGGCRNEGGVASASGIEGRGRLASGEEDGDEVSSGLLEPEPPRLAKVGILGMRGGFMFPGGTSQGSWEQTSLFGLYYRPVQSFHSSMAYEIEFDYASAKRDDGFVTSQLYILRGSLLFANWSDNAPTVVPFFVVGIGGTFGDSSWEATGESGSSSAAMLDVGVGFGPPAGEWDVRFVYSAFLGSENVKGGFMVGAGSKF